MKTLLYLIILFIITSCSTDKDSYWCGDHACINNKEKEAYFKKTMIVEIKNLEKKTSKNNSEIAKILQQVQKGEKKRIKEKNMAKQAKLEDKRKKMEEKNMAKQAKLEDKRKKKEEKNMAKQAKLEDKRKKKEEKYLTKQIEPDEARIIKKEKKTSIQSVNINAGIESPATISTSFNKLVEKITKKNIFRPYPDINDIRD